MRDPREALATLTNEAANGEGGAVGRAASNSKPESPTTS